MERQNQPPTFHPSVKGGKHLDVCDAQEPFGGSSSSNTDGCAASSTMWDQRREDSAAFSSDQSWTDEDDDEVPGQSHGSDRFTDINTQLDFKDKLPLPEFDSCEEVSGSFVPQEDKAPLSSDDDDGTEEVYAPSGGSDEEYAPSGGSDEEYVPSGGSDEEYIPSGGSEGEDKPRRGSKKEHVPSRDSDEEDVPSGDERISAQPSYTKKNYCYVCGKGVIKFARHLVRHVKKDPEAAEVLALPKCSKERKHALERLRNRGNYNHNQEVLRNKSGELKLKMRRRAMSVSAKTVVHCLYCKGLFNRKNMWNHVYRCTYRKMLNSDTQDKSDALRKLTPLETRFSRELPSGMWNLLSTMKHDEVSLTVQNDFSMLQLTQHLMEKHGSDEQKHEYIRQKLRQMGRVLVALQDKSIMNFEDALTPRNFHKVVETVKNMADADEKKQDNVLKIGRSLEKLCRIVLRGKTDREQERDVRTFLRLCRNKWSELVSQSEGSGKRSSTVTFMHDLQTFYRYLEKKSSSASGDLKTQEDTQVYGSLCRVTLTQVFVLNKGEAMVSKMTLKSFKERDAAAQTLSKHFIRINIKRKAGQSVAVLLTTDLVRALKLLIKKRRKCGVHEDNPFVFAKPDFSASSFYNGENCLTVFSNLCRAKYPQDLRSVHHQEHRARVFQILNLENSELHDLAKLLGHDIRADRDHYRSPEAAVELAKISKLLLAMEKGSLERYSGKSLDEIEIKDELEPDVEQDGAKKGGAEDDNKESEEDSASHQQDGEEEQRHKRLSPVEDALEHIRSESDKHFLQEKFISSSKGRGVFTREPIEKSSFVVEYRGEMSALKESRRKKSDCLNDYVFDFSWDGTNWRVDATEEDGSLGRLVNDDHRNPNCVMRKVDCEGRPHLCLFARRNIYEGEEITYNYGDSSYDWRSNIFCDDRRSSFTRITRQKAPNTPTSTSSKWPQHNDSDDDDVEDEEEADSSLDEASDKEHTICPKNRNYCYVCGKGYAKISRHLFTHRYEEAEIAQVFAMRQTSNERKKLLHKLRNRGNYKHNQEVLKTQCGELKLSRRLPNVSVTSKSFAACIYCKGMYGRKDMWRHMKVCTLKKVSTPPSCRNKILTFVADSGLADSQELPAEVNKVLKKLKKDEVRSAVLSDSYIMHLAHCLCLMTTKNESADFINQNLRLVGRLLINLREKSINSMEEAFKPENFSKLVEGVREIAGFNKETKTCSKPSLILRLGNLIKKMSNIRYGKTLKDDASKETVKDAETFVKLCAEEWTKGSSTQAKINKPPTVLFMRDVQIFYKCMEKTMASAVKSLTLYESPQVYTALLRVTIALVSLFNRRAFEVSKLTLQAFKEREEVELPADAAATAAAGPQSQFEQILSKRNMRFNIMGKIKRNVEKKVVLTLTPELLTATELLVSKRKTCGVHDRNPFLFARPVAIITSFYREQTCIATFASRCKAKSEESLRSVFFRKHIARIFQILDLTNEQLDELAKVLGRDIQTVREHYRMPEAAGDIAKISELLAAMEDGSLEKFEGKSFEEIEIPDEVEPDVEQDNPEDPEEPEAVEEEDEDAEGSVKLSEALLLLPERKKRGQRKKKKKSESEEPEPEPEPNDKKSDTEKSENKTPEETLSCNFSDNEDMGFDMDVFDDDEDDVRNVENDGENDSNGSGATAERTEVKETTEQEEQEEQEDENDIGDGGEQDNDTDCEDDVAMDDDDGEKHEEEKDEERGEEQTDRMEVESGVSSDTVDTEKKNRLLAIMRGMKEVKIIIRKLDMNLQPPIHITRLPSVFNKRPKRDNSRQRQTSSSPTNVPDKGVHMFCSNCKKSMMKGHTAFQKKGFTDVFCSKNCLFEKFPINKPNTKTCHYCHKAITQLLDLIMAVVDTKGTMKDFCNLTCVTCFKTNSSPTQTPPPPPPPLCSVCNKSCTTTVELTLQDVVHKFCSDSCLEVYCRDNMPACDNCSSFCRKQPLTLKLEEEMKSICSQKCLEEFKENVQTHHKCTMCHTTRPLSDMVDYKSSEGLVELFCTRTCVTSYKLQPAIIYKLQGAKGSPRSKKRRMENSNSEDDHVTADSSVNENEASKAAESDMTPTLIIAKSWVVCSSCGKRPPKGQMLYQPKSSLEVFCSASCLSERHPHIKVVDKTCYNCCQVIQRPHNIILAPVDDSGTMKELCSETCLSSVQSKRNMAAPKLPPPPGPRSECRMCARFLYCKFKLTLDGVLHKLCNEACFVRYHKVNNMPVPTCYACSSVCADRRFMLPTDNGRKTICSEECLVKSKEKVQTLQLCPTCQTSHQLSDMVENRREDGGLDFFCSNRCMMVHRAQTYTVTESKNPSPEDANIKDVKDVTDMKEALDVKDIKDIKDATDVKPSLPSLSRIKEEPIDEEYNHSLSPSVSTAGIKAETDVAKEDLKIGSVFSLTTDSAPAPAMAPPPASTATPVATQVDLRASCSGCKKVLMDGETVYQRKGRTDIFCSTSCLLKFYQMKPGKKTCHFCLQVMTQTQDVLQGDTDGKVMEFCSQTCLSSFNYKKIMSTKIPIVPMSSHSQCSMCSRYCISKHEAVQHGVVHKLCSDTCFLRFSNLNKLSMCENCGSRCDSPLVLRLEDGSKKLCRTECLAQFKTKVQTPQPCSMCRCSTPVSDMVENRTSEDAVELFCSSSCVMASKIAAVSAAGTPVDCDNCERATVPACHLAMSDASIRNFCSLSCAMAFKEKQKDLMAPRDSSAASEQTQSDFLKAPNKLPCAQCRRNITTTPSVVQKKNKTYFMCSPSCSQEFKKANNIMGQCEYCKNERIIRDVKRVDDRDCNFCSDGCLMLFRHELEKEWGKHCGSCSLCHCISRTLVTSKYDGKEEEFCSEGCNKIFNLLYCHLAKCDTCGRQGELRQSLHMLGEVKHFSDLKCLLHYCQKKLQVVDAVPSPLKPSDTAESSPVIANVISLASALARQDSASSSSSQPASTPDIQTKVIGHVSVQTVPKEVKNKSMLCTPLVHNKGVSCATQMVDTEAQTDTFVPKVVVLPLPVPVYVPLPMNMYSQFTPKPVGLPVPLPVPVILPVASEPERSEGKLSDMSEKKTSQDEEMEREDKLEAREETKEVGGEAQVLKDDTSSCREDVAEEDRGGSRRQEDSTGPPHSPAPPPPPPPPAPAPPQQTQGKAQNKGLKSSQHVESSNRHKVLSHCGTEAWRRWTQWRESRADLDPGSSLAVRLKDDLLLCPAAVLSVGLSRFVHEVKRPDGEPYSPDDLFYLLLNIQQFLFENGRMENIFSDVIYNTFSTEFTKILKTSVTTRGYIHSRVEEDFLWDCKQLGAYSPIVLLNTLLFFCSKYFGFTTVEQHRQLSFAHVTRRARSKPDNTKTTFLRFYLPVSATEPEPDTDGVPAKRRRKHQDKGNVLQMLENTENPLRCPVRLYKFYLSKCPESVRQRSDLFYLQPKHRCTPSSPLWFSFTPLDDATMDATLTRILAVRELQVKEAR